MRPILRIVFLTSLTLFLTACQRQQLTTDPPAPTDAVATVNITPLPGIAEEHLPPVNTLGLDKAETAQADNPDDPKANFDLAYSYYKARAFADAARAFDRTVQLLPDDPKPRLYLGYTQMIVGALDSALATFEGVLKLPRVTPDVKSEAYYNIGVCHGATGADEQAVEAYVKSLGANPKNGKASLALGARAAEKGQFDQARDFFTDAANDLPIGPHKAQAHAALGKLAERGKDTKTALAQYKKALAIDRDNDWALEGVERLTAKKGI